MLQPETQSPSKPAYYTNRTSKGVTLTTEMDRTV
jgi:hypothetical protein